MKKIRVKREYLTIVAIVLIFLSSIVFSLLLLWRMQGIGRVINYVGIVRGGSQRLVKEELMGIADDELIARIDSIVTELLSGSGPNNLIVLQDKEYLESMDLVLKKWDQVKFEIVQVRQDAFRYQYRLLDNNLVAQTLFNTSQEFFEQVNKTAFAAEDFSDRQVNRTRNILLGAGIFSVLLISAGLMYLLRLKAVAESAMEEVNVMKDNLNLGMFLLDKDFIIQPQYSKALETLLGYPDLNKKNFVELLSYSLPQKGQESIKDYLTMVINRSYEAKMLDDINPISELKYRCGETGEEKTLRCGFVRIDRGGGMVFILGIIEDTTAEKMLRQRLSEEEGKREGEMRSLFEILQVDPRIFNDFLEDTEYEFSRINDLLKNKQLSSQFALVDIYQSVHAIKSNAIILGLENFSGKLQNLETEIKKIRDMENITFDDILHITVEIERIMREKNKFRENINKIQSFRISEIRNQDDYVLVQTLLRASDKAARDLDKKVQFVVDEIDPQAIVNGPRRVIKEVLTQLVRNAVYHGIETPEERIARGKEEAGIIRLSINVENGRIHIKFTDDGQGLDFNHIRKRAQELNLFKGLEKIQDKKQLVQLIFSPGFSTAKDAGMHAGRGVGLSLVRERLHDMNGVVKLHTEDGKGTVFNIFIPLEVPIAHAAS